MDRKKFENYMLLNDHYMQIAAQNPFYREKPSQEVNKNAVNNNSNESININTSKSEENQDKENIAKVLPFKIK